MKRVSAKTQKRVDRCITQVAAFARSPAVSQYLVGITAKERTRRSSYERIGFGYFLILEPGLTLQEALELEGALFDKLQASKKLATKYHSEKKGGHRASSGGRAGESYCLYVAGFAP